MKSMISSKRAVQYPIRMLKFYMKTRQWKWEERNPTLHKMRRHANLDEMERVP